MKKIFALSILTSMILFSGCNKNVVFDKSQKIEDYIWNKQKIIEFDFDVNDTISTHLISFEIRHATHFMYDNLLVELIILTPSADTFSQDITLPIRDKEHEFKGKGAGDIWDISIPVFYDFNFPEKGKYKFQIKNAMPEAKTVAIMAVGIKIKKEVKNN
ncbi:MAG: gliding motility lipoprotein GldH [Bacteroidota bacterium]|nr:gliding motility lipoprotein GldH [Bacteroidota bacterium]